MLDEYAHRGASVRLSYRGGGGGTDVAPPESARSSRTCASRGDGGRPCADERGARPGGQGLSGDDDEDEVR